MGRPASKAFLAALRRMARPEKTATKTRYRYAYIPSNDDIPLDEIAHATFAKGDSYWNHEEWTDAGGFAWDVTRPLAEQWPWCDTAPRTSPPLTDAEAATIIEQSSHSYMPFESKHAELIGLVKELPVSPVEPREGWQGEVLDQIESPANIDAQIEAIGNRFAPVDTASREPWRADGETQSTGGETREIDPKVQLAVGLLKMSAPGTADHAKLCEQLCEMFPSKERK